MKLIIHAKSGDVTRFNFSYTPDKESKELKVWYGNDKGKKGALPTETYKYSDLKKVNGKLWETKN